MVMQQQDIIDSTPTSSPQRKGGDFKSPPINKDKDKNSSTKKQ